MPNGTVSIIIMGRVIELKISEIRRYTPSKAIIAEDGQKTFSCAAQLMILWQMVKKENFGENDRHGYIFL